jgi:parvulin-like peptidyl-prolyl isomerase
VAKKKREEKPKEYTRRQLSHFQKQKRRQRIIFISGVSIIVAILLIVLMGWFFTEYRPMHVTVVKVNDAKFNTRYYIDLLEIYTLVYANQQLSVDQLLEQISPSLPNAIVQNELIKQAAEPLGITISDEEIRKTLENEGKQVNDANIDLTRAQQVVTRLKDEYFDTQVVPVSDNQVHMMAMMVESESLALEIQTKLINGDNFTALNEQYALNYYSKSVNEGDYGWHPAAVLEDQLESSIPLDFAFGAAPGAVSPPLADNVTSKQLGYWLIKVLDRPSENQTTVQALLLSDNDQALDIKARLEAGDNLSTLADQYSQHSTSKEKHGDLGVITRSSANTTVISATFDAYIFDPAVETGKWSEPIKDTVFRTEGGYWVVKVVDRENDRALSEEDRTALISKEYSAWVSELWTIYAAGIDTSGATEEVRLRAVERAKKELQSVGG